MMKLRICVRGRRWRGGGLRLLWLLACGFLAMGPARAGYPERPVQILVPYPAGGLNDLVARLLADALRQDLGQPVLVQNKPGANGNLAAAQARRSAPDGHTLLIGNLALLVHNPLLYARPGYAAADLVPVACVTRNSMLLKVPASSPFHSLGELIGYARANPGKLDYASVGNGSFNHLSTELLKARLGFDAVHVPYAGGGAAAIALMAREVDFSIDPQVSFPSEKIRVLAAMDAVRNPRLPEVPSMVEAGYSALDMSSWVGLFALRGTPAAVVDRLRGGAQAALRDPQMRIRLQQAGVEPCEDASAEDFAGRIRRAEQLWAPLIRQLGLRIE